MGSMGVGLRLCDLPRTHLPCAQMNRAKDNTAFRPPLGKGMSLGGVSMDEEILPKFNYYLDESDPDLVVLRRQDGAFVAAFSARGATKEGIEEATKEDYAKLVEAPASVSPPMTHHSPMRWYNPKLDHFEWREV